MVAVWLSPSEWALALWDSVCTGSLDPHQEACVACQAISQVLCV